MYVFGSKYILCEHMFM